MKNYSKSAIACFIFATMSLTSCLDLASGTEDTNASLRQSVSQAATIELPQLPCDFDNRKTTGVVKEDIGFIMPGPGNSDSNPVYLIDIPSRSMRYSACNMPDVVKHGGMKIKFSGDVKEIYANERWAGTPFKLTAIDIMESEPVITPTAVTSNN